MSIMPYIEFSFWLSLLLILYAYIGYPLILWLFSFSKVSRSDIDQSDIMNDNLPKVSLLISAYNEEYVIESKIINSLSLDYPNGLLEIVVVSDGSTDRTNEIVSRFRDKGVILRYYEGRVGKSECLNRAVPLAKGEIVVFSDANSQYDNGAIRDLVKHFDDNTIGFVTGWTKYVSKEVEDSIGAVGIYSRLEMFTKLAESKISSCVGADGAIFAIRKKLYRPLHAHDINDFIIPLSIIQQGFRGIMENRAFCSEKTARGTKEEFYRQVRITTRTIRAIVSNRGLLNPLKYGFFSFELFSHKICKFLTPFFMVIILLTSLILSLHKSLYFAFFVGQAVCYLMAWVNYRGHRGNYLISFLAVLRTFVALNIAILWGCIKYIKGETYTTWSPTQR